MPVINIKQTPSISEGEYAGVIENVVCGVNAAGDSQFTYQIRMKDGRVVRDRLSFSENVHWRIVALIKSADLVRPDNGGPFNLTTDDLEGRVIYFAVKYNQGKNEQVYTNINFHTMSYAIQLNPVLAGLYPPQTPRRLREAPPEDFRNGSEPSPSTPSTPPVQPTGTSVGMAEAEDNNLTPEEYAQVLTYAQTLAQAKRNKAGKAAA